MNFLGMEILPIHVQIVQTVISLFLAGGIAAAAYKLWNEYWGIAFDRFVITKTLEDHDKNDARAPKRVHLKFRGSDRTERLEDAVRGKFNRRRMVKAARKCSLMQPFVALLTDAHQDMMHESVRNALTRLNRDGEAAELAGLPVKTAVIPYAIIATDDDGDSPTFMFRAMPITENDLRRYLDDIVWVAPNGKLEHPRIWAHKMMAVAYFRNNGYADICGRRVKIVDTFELKVRA